MKIRKIIYLFLLLTSFNLSAAELNDSIELKSVLNEVLTNYPLIIKSQKELVTADAKINLSKSAYLPDINMNGSFTYLGPVTSLSLPGLGSFNLFPPYNYSASVTVNQSIYDFGRTEKNIALDEKNKELIKLSTEQLKQRLTNMAVASFYNICLLQKAISIKQEQLNNLNEHLDFVQKKADSGSATKYDIISTKVRISNTENQLTDLTSAIQVQKGQLNALLGKKIDEPINVKSELKQTELLLPNDSLFNNALNNRNEIKISLQKEQLTRAKLELVNTQKNPSLNAFATGGYKNSYLNERYEDVGKLNYVVGIALKVPIFDANRTKITKTQVNADLEALKQETEVARRTVSNEVNECIANTNAAQNKVKKSELQLQQATQGYELANINYKAGAITNFDLLDSYNALAESRMQLFKTKIDYTLNLYRLKIALGENIN